MTSALAPGAARSEPSTMKARRCLLQTVVVLVLFSLARAFGLTGPTAVGIVILTGALAVVAWSAGASLADLGLRPANAWAGLRWGAAAFAAVLLVLVLAAAIPLTRGFLHDARAQIDGGRLAHELLVSIVVLTAIPEEFAFRGVLLGSALRMWAPWRAVLVTSTLFGLWHIAPTLATRTDNPAVSGASAGLLGQILVVAGAVVVTFVAGLGGAWGGVRFGSPPPPRLAPLAPTR